MSIAARLWIQIDIAWAAGGKRLVIDGGLSCLRKMISHSSFYQLQCIIITHNRVNLNFTESLMISAGVGKWLGLNGRIQLVAADKNLALVA